MTTKLDGKIRESRVSDGLVVLQREGEGGKIETVAEGPGDEGFIYSVQEPGGGDSVTIDPAKGMAMLASADGTRIREYSLAARQEIPEEDKMLLDGALTMFNSAQESAAGFHPVDPFSLIP